MALVTSYAELNREIEMGNKNRTIRATKMNLMSSRAHTVFEIRVTQARVIKINGVEILDKKMSKV